MLGLDRGYHPSAPNIFAVKLDPNIVYTKLAGDGSRLVFWTYLGKSGIGYFFSRLRARMEATDAIEVVTIDKGRAIHSRALRTDGSGLLYDSTYTPPVGGKRRPRARRCC